MVVVVARSIFRGGLWLRCALILGGIWERGGMDREGGRGTEYVVYLCGREV